MASPAIHQWVESITFYNSESAQKDTIALRFSNYSVAFTTVIQELPQRFIRLTHLAISNVSIDSTHAVTILRALPVRHLSLIDTEVEEIPSHLLPLPPSGITHLHYKRTNPRSITSYSFLMHCASSLLSLEFEQLVNQSVFDKMAPHLSRLQRIRHIHYIELLEPLKTVRELALGDEPTHWVSPMSPSMLPDLRSITGDFEKVMSAVEGHNKSLAEVHLTGKRYELPATYHDFIRTLSLPPANITGLSLNLQWPIRGILEVLTPLCHTLERLTLDIKTNSGEFVGECPHSHTQSTNPNDSSGNPLEGMLTWACPLCCALDAESRPAMLTFGEMRAIFIRFELEITLTKVAEPKDADAKAAIATAAIAQLWLRGPIETVCPSLKDFNLTTVVRKKPFSFLQRETTNTLQLNMWKDDSASSDGGWAVSTLLG